MKFIFFILTLLLASLYAHSEYIDSVDVNYCLTMCTSPMLSIDKNYDIKIQTVKKTEELIMCEFPFRWGYGLSIEHVLTGKSGQSIVLKGGIGVKHSGNVKAPHQLPREIQIESLVSPQFWGFNISREEKEGIYKDLLRFKDKIINGDMEVFIGGCKPHELRYNIKIRGKIVGECECDSLK